MKFFEKHLFSIPLFLYIINVSYQFIFLLNPVIDTFSDQGIYLYDMKLVLQGYIPYKDFFLAHPPFLIYAFAMLLKLVNFDIFLFDIAYTMWNLSIIFPLFFIIKRLTNNILISIISVLLFIFFPEYQLLDARFFSLRGASLPFLTWGIYFFFLKKLSISAFFLGIFAISLVSNAQIAIIFIICTITGEYLFKNETFNIKTYKKFCIIFFGIIIFMYSIFLIIPGGFENVFLYHLNRYYVTLYWRIKTFEHIFLRDFVLLFLGIIGSCIITKKTKLIGIWTLISTIVIVLGSRSFASFYLATLIPGLTISSSFLILYFSKTLVHKTLMYTIVLLLVFLFSFPIIIRQNNLKNTSDHLKLIKILRVSPEPQFMTHPIFSFYTKKQLTFHYFVADTGYFGILQRKNIRDSRFIQGLLKSNTIVLDNYFTNYLDKNLISTIRKKYTFVKKFGEFEIFVRK